MGERYDCASLCQPQDAEARNLCIRRVPAIVGSPQGVQARLIDLSEAISLGDLGEREQEEAKAEEMTWLEDVIAEALRRSSAQTQQVKRILCA